MKSILAIAPPHLQTAIPAERFAIALPHPKTAIPAERFAIALPNPKSDSYGALRYRTPRIPKSNLAITIA